MYKLCINLIHERPKNSAFFLGNFETVRKHKKITNSQLIQGLISNDNARLDTSKRLKDYFKVSVIQGLIAIKGLNVKRLL